MKKVVFILMAICLMGCSNGVVDVVEDVEFYAYPDNTLVFECQTMVFLKADTVHESKWLIPRGTELRFVIINSNYMRFANTPDVYMVNDKDIIIAGDGTLKTARLEILTPPNDLHYPSIAVWYNDDYSLIDYEISK